MKRLLTFLWVFALALLFAAPAWAKELWCTQDGGSPTHNGSSLANAFSAADFNTAGNWGAGAGKISAGDTVYMGFDGVLFSTRLAPQGSGTNATTRIILKGDGKLSGSGPTISWSGTSKSVGINIATQDYIAVIGMEFTQTGATGYSAFNLTGSIGCLIEDNYIHDTSGDAITAIASPPNSNNIVRHNWMTGINSVGGGSGAVNSTSNFIGGAANIFEYNTMGTGLDRIRFNGIGNVARNNYFGANNTSLFPNVSHPPNHTDGFQSNDSDPAGPPVQLLFEKNYDTDNRDGIKEGGQPQCHAFFVRDTTNSGTFVRYIIRFNQWIREAENCMSVQVVNKVRFYNNNIVDNGIDQPVTTRSGNIGYITSGAGTLSDDHDYRNNAFPFNPNFTGSHGLITDADRPTNFTSGANFAWNSSGSQGILPTGASPANLAQSNPSYTNGTGNLGADDYTLQSGSILRAAGAPVTTAVGDGTGSTSLTVVDSLGLFSGATADGWPLLDGDWIKIGAGAFVQVAGVNNTTKVVTLGATRTWGNGDAVWVKGNEDVGALPYDYVPALSTPTVTQTTATAAPTALTATTTTADSVRGVEFLVSGIPAGIDYYDGDDSYSITTTPSGPQLVEARALNYWASAIPTVSSYLLINQDPSSFATGTVTISSIPLTWTDNSAGVDSFSIEQSLNGTTGWAQVATPAAGVTSATISSLAANTTYYYRIRAVNSGVYSGYSANANATTAGAPAAASSGIRGNATMKGKAISR